MEYREQDQWLNKVGQAVNRHLAESAALSRDLAAHPEVSGREYRSSKQIVELLRRSGFQVQYPFAEMETAFCGLLDCGEGPAICYLTEYDALPEIGHGCGHNLHGAMSVLAGLALAELREDFVGKIYVIGTPSEEEAGAKVQMAEKGIFDQMDLAAMVHSWSGGKSYVNMELLGLRCYQVHFYGQEAHAVAGPWKGKSALAAARKFLDLIDARRECFTPDLRVNSIFVDGGKAPNIIPACASLKLELRADSAAKLEQADDMVRKCADGAALALDCTVALEKAMEDFADMICVPVLEEETYRLMTQVGQKMAEKIPPNGSSDVGNVSYRCPTVQPLLSICPEFHALHTTEMACAACAPQADAALCQGASVLAALGLRVLRDATYRQEVQRSFLSARAAKQQL